MDKLSVFLVDDHKLFREGLKLLLQGLECVGEIKEASSGKEFLYALAEYKPDIVFMDIEMPEMDGIQTTIKSLNLFPDLKIIALSMYSEEAYYGKMIEAGAQGFLLKDSDIEEVESAISIVSSGKSYFSQEILFKILQKGNDKKSISKTSELTEREKEVLYLICKGLSNQEIANNLLLSKRTIDKHRENLLLKTDSNNTASLVIYAIKHGIIEV
jgi:DNA-binding NarL/FixJ family response regulator